MGNSQKIVPFLWFDKQAEEAVRLYTSLFEDSEIGEITRYGKEGFEIHGQPEGLVMTAPFKLAGYSIVALNGGPQFKFNPSISFFVQCETEAEVDRLWGALSEGGSVLMELDRYDWSEKYGWLEDRYGLSWQISVGKLEDVGQKITPCLLFVGEQCGRAEEAINRYTSIFDNSSITSLLHHGEGEGADNGSMVLHAQFKLDGESFMAMDSDFDHDFAFNEAVSLQVSCASQVEVDYFWQQLSDGGEEGPCGWLKDRFGVSWQVVPTVLFEMLGDSDREKADRVTKSFMQMSKFDIAELERAYAGE